MENSILIYEIKGKARTRPEIFRVVLGHAHNVAHVRPRSKNGTKNHNLHLRSNSKKIISKSDEK